MVPSLLQLVRRGRGHLDAASWSCEILQSPLQCEDSTYYATEKSICSGRHPQRLPTTERISHSAPLQPICLSTKWAACRWKEIYPSFNWIREWIHKHRDAMNGWVHLRSFSVAAESTDMSPVSDFARVSFCDAWMQGTPRSMLAFDRNCLKAQPYRKIVSYFITYEKKTEKEKNSGSVENVLGYFGSWCAGEQLVGKPIAEAYRQARLRQHLSSSLPSISTQTRFNKRCPFIWN